MVLQQTVVFILSEFEPEIIFKAWKDERWRKQSVTRPINACTKVYKAKGGNFVLLGSYCLRMRSVHLKEDSTIIIICRSLRSILTPGLRSRLQLLRQAAAAAQYFSKISGERACYLLFRSDVFVPPSGQKFVCLFFSLICSL